MVDKYNLSFNQLIERIDSLDATNIPKNYVEVQKKDGEQHTKKDTIYQNSIETR